MPSAPIPPEVSEFIPKANALDWRGFHDLVLCSHQSNLHGEFYPLATDGVIAIIKKLDGSFAITQLSAIIFPKPSDSPGFTKRKPKIDEATKLRRSLTKLGYTAEQIEIILNP